jgi:glucosyl-dolichyl phosphate glucuronosyltransferase
VKDEVITVAICTYRRYGLLADLLAELPYQTLPRDRFRILVVDNTDSEEQRQAFAQRVTGTAGLDVVVSAPPGLSRARNTALAACRTPFIVYIDDDATPSPEWLESIVDAFSSSRASVVAGPIDPKWPLAPPSWLPDKYLACLTVLDYGSVDHPMSDYEFAYGTNMAFVANALREVGGFDTGLGRIGARTLLSDEEIQVQLALRKRGHKSVYAARARVTHLVHKERVTRNYFRARMGWQAVSTLLHESPLWNAEQSRSELLRACTEAGVDSSFAQLFATRDPRVFTAQIDIVYHLLLLVLNANNEADATFEHPFLSAPPAALPSVSPAVIDPGPAAGSVPSYVFQPVMAVSPQTRHLMVDSLTSHAFLYDIYGELPGAQLRLLHGNLWDRQDAELDKLEECLTSQLASLTFLTLEPFLWGPSWPRFDRLIRNSKLPITGILHRLPWTKEQAELLRGVAERLQILVLAESMQEKLFEEHGIGLVTYLPLHPTHAPYLGRDSTPTRERIGASDDMVVFSLLGEARIGKGYDLLLASLAHVPPASRRNMFFLFGGRAKDYHAHTVSDRLLALGYPCHVALKSSVDPFAFAVLTERELGEFIGATDVGLLLYQEDQRKCMSGVLPNYAWGRRSVVVTADSIVGRLVKKYDLGIAIDDETPEAVARAIHEMYLSVRDRTTQAFAGDQYRESISRQAVLSRLGVLLSPAARSESAVHPSNAVHKGPT